MVGGHKTVSAAPAAGWAKPASPWRDWLHAPKAFSASASSSAMSAQRRAARGPGGSGGASWATAVHAHPNIVWNLLDTPLICGHKKLRQDAECKPPTQSCSCCKHDKHVHGTCDQSVCILKHVRPDIQTSKFDLKKRYSTHNISVYLPSFENHRSVTSSGRLVEGEWIFLPQSHQAVQVLLMATFSHCTWKLLCDNFNIGSHCAGQLLNSYHVATGTASAAAPTPRRLVHDRPAKSPSSAWTMEGCCPSHTAMTSSELVMLTK